MEAAVASEVYNHEYWHGSFEDLYLRLTCEDIIYHSLPLPFFPTHIPSALE
jgi:hypothetical protein